MEEDGARWRAKASEEAASSASLMGAMEEQQKQMHSLQRELETWKRTADEALGRIRLKEETVNKALAAREAAEKSLAAADRRVSELKVRMEAMAQEYERADKGTSLEQMNGGAGGGAGTATGCWDSLAAWSHSRPWTRRQASRQRSSGSRGESGRHPAGAEMEPLTQPLL
eukprot:TRINITY_DN15208_c0_g1_i2.p1 TRINITY_DN15208_c0_g1~~TRINITY_DN15208_c0_g1_i2.p1  ORF type:complete len:178 (-),score=57.13 TRINITY_DN15208_c0_g1_i2:146-655(-)